MKSKFFLISIWKNSIIDHELEQVTKEVSFEKIVALIEESSVNFIKVPGEIKEREEKYLKNYDRQFSKFYQNYEFTIFSISNSIKWIHK